MRPTISYGPRRAPGVSDTLFRQGIRSHLEVHHLTLILRAAFVVERRARGPGGPQASALPARIGIVDAAVETFREKSVRIRHAQDGEARRVG